MCSKINKALIWVSTCGWLCFLSAIDTAKILAVFPFSAQSRFRYTEAIMRSLHDANHEVTIITPFASHKWLKNYKIINSSKNNFAYFTNDFIKSFLDISKFSLLKISTKMEAESCQNVLQLPEIQHMLQFEERIYDVMFIEIITLHECFLPLAEKLDIPVIGTVVSRSWQTADNDIGNSRHPALIPFEFGSYNDEMTFFQRLTNIWDYLTMEFYYYFIVKPKLNHLYRDYYAPNLLHKKKVSLIFYNSHPSILPRNSAPNAIEVGGINVKAANPLPQDLQVFIDGATDGVILFTLGSWLNASIIMPVELKTAFKESFARIRQRVIWKFEEQVEGLSENVLLTKWIPQRDILAQKNVKAFITHCGIAGVYEAIHEGVPLVLIPFSVDQKSNAAFLRKLEVGVYLERRTAGTDTILGALNAVINDTRYYNNMQRLSHTFRDRPMTPAETIVYWTEYVIRHKGAFHLRTAGADMPLFQYLLLDVILFLFVVPSLMSYVGFILFRKIYKSYFTQLKNSVTTSATKKSS